MTKSSQTFLLILLIGFSLFIAGCKHADPNPTQGLSADQVAVVQALNNAVFPIQNADPTRNFVDLAPLDTVLAKAQVVGLGEGTHGSREFLQMKDRLFRYLVQTHGHQAIGFEVSFGLSVAINRFIHGQNTSLAWTADAVKSLRLWPWQVDEVRELFQWMKDYNATKTPAQQLSFYGFDCPSADDNFPIIREFLASVEPSSVAQIDSLSKLYTLTVGATTNSPWQQYTQRLPALYNLFVTNETKWTAGGGKQAYEIAKHAARVLIQHQDFTNSNSVSYCASYTKRDQYMAENIQWIYTTMGVSKLSLWAHDGHVASAPTIFCGGPSMGYLLKQQLNDKYLIIGTTLSNGTFTVKDGSQFSFPLTTLSVQAESMKSTSNYLLGKAQSANFILNLNQPRSDALLNTWLTASRSLLLVGASYDVNKPEQAYYTIPLKGTFDVLIHFRDTTPTHLLP
jgi:erythromycin esterase